MIFSLHQFLPFLSVQVTAHCSHAWKTYCIFENLASSQEARDLYHRIVCLHLLALHRTLTPWVMLALDPISSAGVSLSNSVPWNVSAMKTMKQRKIPAKYESWVFLSNRANLPLATRCVYPIRTQLHLSWAQHGHYHLSINSEVDTMPFGEHKFWPFTFGRQILCPLKN